MSVPISSVGLVHDYLLTMRGAERTFAVLAECWPRARIYTTLYDAAGTGLRFGDRAIETSYLQRLRVGQRGFRRLLPLYPRAVERLPVAQHDLVLSSSSAFAHGVRVAQDAVHVCYCHSPFRYAWHERDLALAEVPRALRPLLARMLDRMKTWDRDAAARVTHYIANSAITRDRIADFYGREARVVHPPVDVGRFTAGQPEDFFLVVSELARHKRVEVALEAAARAGRALTVVGSGPELRRLQTRYGASARFAGAVSDDELADLYRRARALVVPNVEEFGIAAVEAQAAGRPVVAVDEGGARETVIDGETGVLVQAGTEQLAEALRDVDFDSFSPQLARRHAETFAPERFKERLVSEVARLVGADVGAAATPR
jgi:glycosyltransferase involved in cell wall biosynthesis